MDAVAAGYRILGLHMLQPPGKTMPMPDALTIQLPRCGKIPYTSVAEARLVIKSIKGRGRYVRPYKCQSCGEWHITSRPTRAKVKKGW